MEHLRSNLHFRSRSRIFGSLWRVRHNAIRAFSDYFNERQFLSVNTPILTSHDCEGAVFGDPAYLTVSGQLHLELMASSFSRVYTLGPTFRAEKSQTPRHLAEFWMLEAEAAFLTDLGQLLDLVEDCIQTVTSRLLEDSRTDLEQLNGEKQPEKLKKLEELASKPFTRITYKEALEVLAKSKKTWEFPVKWGEALQSEHERYLVDEVYCGPVFVTKYPRACKPFYMLESKGDGTLESDTVECTDLLVPGIGELHREDVLRRKMANAGMDTKEYDWYLDLRSFGGTPHGGYMMLISGMHNIKDMIPLPRWYGSCRF
ncbi:hypothetical protein BC829DRAFT_379736 [Chytridium lagenaria]|nr:hypothetical protein BC829DRAFT_379736 [Chytridium lagenaria]